MKLVIIGCGLVISLLAVSSMAADFDFFYFVQQWPGSFCDTSQGCCFPDTGKPAADFGIHGLWPNYANCQEAHRHRGLARALLGDAPFASIVGRDGGKCWPEYCNNSDPLIRPQVEDLVPSLNQNWPTLSCKSGESFEFWSYEWRKHGTCSNLTQHGYFERALALKAAHNLTAILAGAGIVPSDSDDTTYSLSSIGSAIHNATGFTPNLECNQDAGDKTQLFQVYLCVDHEGKELIKCPHSQNINCAERVKLPAF